MQCAHQPERVMHRNVLHSQVGLSFHSSLTAGYYSWQTFNHLIYYRWFLLIKRACAHTWKRITANSMSRNMHGRIEPSNVAKINFFPPLCVYRFFVYRVCVLGNINHRIHVDVPRHAGASNFSMLICDWFPLYGGKLFSRLLRKRIFDTSFGFLWKREWV